MRATFRENNFTAETVERVRAAFLEIAAREPERMRPVRAEIPWAERMHPTFTSRHLSKKNASPSSSDPGVTKEGNSSATK